MKQNIKVDKELIKLAKELCGTAFEDQIPDGVEEKVDAMNVEQLMKIFIDYVDALNTANDSRIKLQNKAKKKFDNGQELSLQFQRYLNLNLPNMADNVTGMESTGGWYNTMNAYQKSIKQLNAVLIRINKSVSRFEFISQNTNKLDEEVKEYIESAINFLKEKNNVSFDEELFNTFVKALNERGLQYISNASKQNADKEFPDYIRTKNNSGQLTAKINKTLRLAAEWNKASFLYITTMNDIPEEQEVKAFVSNINVLVEQAAKVSRKLKSETQMKSSKIINAGIFDSLKSTFSKLINKIINLFKNIKEKIDNFLKNDFDKLDKINDELQKILN